MCRCSTGEQSPQEWLASQSSESKTVEIPTVSVQSRTPESSMTDRMFGAGSPMHSLTKAAIIDPLLGINQLASNLFGDSINKGANSLVKNEEARYEQGRTNRGLSGFDPVSLAGAVISPFNKIIPNSTAISALGKIGQSAVSNATAAAIFSPVLGDDYLTDKNLQMGLGGLLGGGLHLGGATLGKVSDLLHAVPATVAGRTKALYRYISELTGDDKQLVINELRNSGELVAGSKPTVSEVLSSADMPSRLVSEEARLSTTSATAPAFINRFKEQANARMDTLVKQFGNSADLEAAKTTRLTTTTPMSFFEGGSKFWSLGPTFRWPIFSAGKIRQNIRVENARQEQALIRYEQTVLTSLEEVENALVGFGKEQERYRELAKSEFASRRAVTLANDQFRSGLVDFLSVLEAERTLFLAQEQLVRSEQVLSQNAVRLYKALGGGWQEPLQRETIASAANGPANASMPSTR